MGRSTYVVSLPSPWVKAVGIAPRSEVSLEVLPDMSLRLSVPGRHGVPRQPAQYVISAGADYEADDIVREVIGGYVAGATSIRVLFGGAGPDTVGSVKQVLRNKLMGLEVVDEDSSSVTFQVVVDPKIADLPTIMERMAKLTYGMHADIVSYARGSLRREVLDAMGGRDDLVDKLYLLALRFLTTVLGDPGELSRRGLSYPELPYVLMFLKNVERIADHAVAVASIVKDHGIDGRLLEVYAEALELFREASRSFVLSDKGAAFKMARVVKRVKASEEECVSSLSASGLLSVHAARLMDIIARMIARCLDTVELTINLHAVRVSGRAAGADATGGRRHRA